MNPAGFLATWIPVLFLLYNFYHTAVHVNSLWNTAKCESGASGASGASGRCLCPAYNNETKIEFDIYLSGKDSLPSDYEASKYLLYSTAQYENGIGLSWNVDAFDEKNQSLLTPSINATKFGLNKNRTLFAHIIGYYKENEKGYNKYDNIFSHRKVELIYYDRPRAITYNLYNSNDSNDKMNEKEEINGLIVPYFVPNITIYYLIDDICFNLSSLPNEVYPHLVKKRQLFSNAKKSKRKSEIRKKQREIGNMEYYPIVYNSELTRLHKYAIALMNSYGEWEFDEMLKLNIKIEPISLGFMRLYQTMEQSCRSMERDWEFGKADLDQIKSLFVDTNPWLTLATFVAAALHTIFSFLAMKSDISFWNAQDRSLAGLSTNSVIFESISSFVILAYLIDSEQTNKIVIALMLAECFLGLWKLKRIYTLKQQNQRILDAKKKRESKNDDNKDVKVTKKRKDEKMQVDKTESLDEKATRYMVYFLIPTIIGYSIYSFIYHEHKSMLSFVINSMASCVYGLGFIHLTPQLFINYELKSVESLPWKVLIYRFFNTFVDDLFSFIIDMPTLHRLACFRDDVVFVIFCIQWWIYGAKKRNKNDQETKEKKNK